ncbi:MAG: exodeoxyribonuclease VII small subunit [Candidatus Lindowbacteria bacterium]|nr:exodeoxyribonuclease VII small subunit [Candidatus Lindowbacteria bacterium]
MAKRVAKSKSDESFEELLEHLEVTVEKLEKEEVLLEDAIKLYEEGLKVHSQCTTILDDARVRIKKLTEDSGIDKSDS